MCKQTKNLKNREKVRQTIPIHKQKDFIKKFHKYLIKIKKQCENPNQYIRKVHKYFKNCQKKTPINNQLIIVSTRQKIKYCNQCHKIQMNSSKMNKCYFCDDYYHQNCSNIKQPSKKGDQWLCQKCQQEAKQKYKKNEKLKQMQQKLKKCHKCSKEPKNKNSVPQKLKYCIKCQQWFHKQCFQKEIICGNCNEEVQKKIKQTQPNLLDYGFKSQISPNKRNSSLNKKSNINQQQLTKLTINSEQQKKSKETNFYKKNRQFKDEEQTQPYSEHVLKYNFPDMTENQIKQYKQQLLRAILIKKMSYCEKLQPINCQLNDNNQDSLDFSLTQMSYQDKKIYQKYKNQPIGPFKLQYRQNMGYDVIADMDLPKNMIVCQYIGDVVTLRKALESNNDSLMQLRVGKNSDQTLFIRPEKYTNIARFINGINNQSKVSGNVSTLRKTIKGIPAVILYTNKKVKKGESLAYDYNAGGKNNYDTSHFV